MNALQAQIATYTDAQIETYLRHLDATFRQRRNPAPVADRSSDASQAERMVHAALADELTRRWDIDAEVDEIFQEVAFTGTYLEAMLSARDLKRSRSAA